MELHDPPGLGLPPLKIQRATERTNIESSADVRTLISTQRLLTPELNAVYIRLVEASEEIRTLLRVLIDNRLWNDDIWAKPQKTSKSKTLNEFFPPDADNIFAMFSKHFTFPETDWKSALESAMEPKAVLARPRVIAELQTLSNKMQDDLSMFEKNFGSALPILTTLVVYTCPQCHRIGSLDRFVPQSCRCGKTLGSTSDVQQVSLKYVGDSLTKFIRAHYWLEHGVSHLLRTKGMSTLVGVQVLGHSGNWHEIDVVGESHQNRYRIFCECKASEVKPSHIFVFWGKMNDTGCTRGFIFTTAGSVPVEITRLARSGNITLVTDVVNSDDLVLLSQLSGI